MTTKQYFGTDGIRGKVGKGLVNAEFMLKLGWAAGKVLAKHQAAVVLIGKDTRISGYMLESALEAGFSAAGVDILLLGPMPTPAIAYLTRSVRASAGVVISASHNPYDDNGIKFFNHEGFKLSDAIEDEIEVMLNSPMETVVSEHLGKAKRMEDAAGRYIEFCKSTFPDNLDLKGLKVTVDCANGAAYAIAPKIFYELGASVSTVADKPNGFNINKACGATHLDSLRQMVTTVNADVGIALDGDGDRLIMVDDQGVVVDGDELLAILALYRDIKPKGIVGTVMSNLGLEQVIKAAGIDFCRAKVGDRHVLELLRARGWELGGEASGHLVDLRYTTTGDGIISALQILRIMQQTGKSLSELKSVMVKRPQLLINIAVEGSINLAEYPVIVKAIAAAEKQLHGRGRVLVRASGTEPVVRVMAEGNDQDEVYHIAQQLAETIRSSVHDV